jgi:hypothetical protein
MGQEEVFGAEEADAGGADGVRRLRIGDVVDVGQQLDLRAVGGDRGVVAVQDELVLEVEELALHLAIGRDRLAVGPDQDQPVAAIDDDDVARADLVRDADDAGDGRDARLPREDRPRGWSRRRSRSRSRDRQRARGSSPGWAGAHWRR